MTRTAVIPALPSDPPGLAARRQDPAVAPQTPPPAHETLSPDLRLVIEEDPNGMTFIYKTVNRITGEVLQQFPREQLLKLKDSAEYAPGQLIKAGA